MSARNILGGLVGGICLLSVACSGGDPSPAASPSPPSSGTPPAVTTTAMPTQTPTWTPSPTPTPRPGCIPDAGSDHYPVKPGAERGQPCLSWERADGPVTIRVEFRSAFDATVQAPPVEYAVPAGSTSFTLPPGAFAPLPGSGSGCTGRLPYIAEVTAGGERLGGVVSAAGCWAVPVTAEGCIGPGGARGTLNLHVTAVQDGLFLGPIADGDARFPACIAWADSRSDETGIRVQLHYFGSDERFVYRLPPGSVSFIVPESDSTPGEPGTPEWLARKDFEIQVIAETPRGDEHIASTAVQVM